MEIIIKKANINKPQLRSLLAKVVAKSISDLSEPCYCPNFKKHFYDILKITKVSAKDVREFNKRKWKGRKEEKFDLFQDSIANYYIFLMHSLLKENDQLTFRYLMIFYIIRHYISLFKKKFKYCNKDVFKYSLETLTKTHLFSREKTIGNALVHLAYEMIRRYSTPIKENDIDKISKFIQESRTRISQSMKSFASAYYKSSAEGLGLKTLEEPAEDDEKQRHISTEKSTKAIDIVVKKIVIYKFIDLKAQEEIRKITKVKSSLSTLITNNLTNIKYSDNIRIIFTLFIKKISDIDSLCGEGYNKYLRDLMFIKKSIAPIYFKQQVKILMLKIMEDIGYSERYSNFTTQTQFLLSLFLAYYLTSVFRNTICFK